MMAERRIIDEDGHCSICGYAIDLESETMESHECPPGFSQPQADDLTAERAGFGKMVIAESILDNFEAISLYVIRQSLRDMVEENKRLRAHLDRLASEEG